MKFRGYVRFRKNLLFRRVHLGDDFYGEVVWVRKDEKREMYLNEDAYLILELLDSGNSVDEVIAAIADGYDEPEVSVVAAVEQVLSKIYDKGFIQFADTPLVEGVVPDAVSFNSSFSPESVSIELLSACNLKCKHCYGAFGNAEGEFLKKEVVFDILDQLSDMHVKDVSFTGGEVLLHPDFIEILRYAHSKKFVLSFLTNGTMITEDFADSIREFLPLEVQVSIDGHNAEIHDPFRGVEGAFEKAVHAVKLLDNAGCTVVTGLVMNKKNIDHFDDMDKLVRELGVGFKSGPMMKSGDGVCNADEYYITPEQYYNVFKDSAEEKSVERTGDTYISRCSAGKNRFSIKSDGSVIPCEVLPVIPSLILGNIYEARLKDFITGFDREKAFGTMNALELDECRSCEFIAECKGGCVAVSYSEVGGFGKPDPFSCAKTRAVYGKPFSG